MRDRMTASAANTLGETLGVLPASDMRRFTAVLAITVAMVLARPPDETALRPFLMSRVHGPFGRHLQARLPPAHSPHALYAAPLAPPPHVDWVSREIERLNSNTWKPNERSIPEEEENPETILDEIRQHPETILGALARNQMTAEEALSEIFKTDPITLPEVDGIEAPDTEKEVFALTPQDGGFDAPEKHPVKYERDYPTPPPNVLRRAAPAPLAAPPAAIPPRRLRQNPNLSKARHLVAENLEMMRSSNTASDEHATPTASTRYVHVNPRPPLAADSVYGIAIIVAVGSALTVALAGLVFGWYSLSKKAKAAASVDYPAYGVTGPAADTADRKLAQSAHMFHYQHQKQQILAMERTASECRGGSLSDAESDEDNEEGDYTVYECPGFASTGDMEVKNPMFSEEPTPATPGHCELVKPQPKE